ncbi:polyprenyl synthetase family protein [Mycobacterium paraterrae]|uniref:Polyprenyl synthetase family protein n=1 Tax=Mycobacterium paraterrae TaxID=577492 RepID=A0ABY3VS95_9MYCO|nr:polyprenyl synthetase family protein [Mycobacterium paraterrae]UMB72373.1 polyprenyl synthetase family protein [Mycobacterium paraterrae]
MGLRAKVLSHLGEFVAARCAAELAESGVDVAGDILLNFVAGGKCLRSTFMYLGWLAGSADSDEALFASAGLELLHAFALIQDDVMDAASSRRGRPAAHIQFSQWHRKRKLSGTAERFGESAAILLGDLCLIWAEQMMRESGLEYRSLRQAWPRYDAMRTELALGQFADLASDIRDLPSMDTVLEVARRKSGNYTVRRPLEIGAAMSGCSDRTITGLGRYGEAVGEAFQLRDDLLGVFGSAAVTGKPDGQDLVERKATSVVIAAHQLADPATRTQLTELMNIADLDEDAIKRWRSLIVTTGAVQWIEDTISDRVGSALKELDQLRINEPVRAALTNMASVCTERTE